LLFKLAAHLVMGYEPSDLFLNLHPMAYGAWFGLIATSINLLPIGQLDGGHISYAVLGRKSSYVTIAGIILAVGLIYFSITWALWCAIMVIMLLVFGPHHPRTFDEEVPLDPMRQRLAVVALIMLVLCFTPNVMQEYDGTTEPREPTSQVRLDQSTLSGSMSTTTRRASSGRAASDSARISRMRVR
ncbi:MAG: site-2 protease family protein, partial [Acidobacteriaceae bacterium]|nr:site-2 protease family protein [Acidobacteriaceae bacterium]